MFEITNDLLIKFLLFILFFSVSIILLRRTFLKDKVLSSVVALAISLMAIFYISYSQLDFITQTYTLTGMIILISIPYVIIFFFIYSSDIVGVLRKMVWIFCGVITLLLLQKNTSLSSEIITNISTIIVIIIIAIIILDKSIKNYFTTRKNLKR